MAGRTERGNGRGKERERENLEDYNLSKFEFSRWRMSGKTYNAPELIEADMDEIARLPGTTASN